MIHLFDRRRRVMFFPVGWANSLVRWVLGVFSPSGTIIVGNTSNPGEDGSLSLDVNVEAVANAVTRRLGGRELSEVERIRIRDVVRAYIDGASIGFSDGRFSVNVEWLTEHVKSIMSSNALVAPSSPATVASGYVGNAGVAQLADTHGIAGAGAVISLACRGTSDGLEGNLFFRDFTITEDGRILSISREKSQMSVISA